MVCDFPVPALPCAVSVPVSVCGVADVRSCGAACESAVDAGPVCALALPVLSCVVLVLVSVWRKTRQPRLPSRRRRDGSRPAPSTIARLPSGASTSPLAVCAEAARLAGAFFATVARFARCVRRLGSLRHRATALVPVRGIPPPMRRVWLGRGYPPVAIRNPLAGVCRSRAADVAPAPLAFAASLAR